MTPLKAGQRTNVIGPLAYVGATVGAGVAGLVD